MAWSNEVRQQTRDALKDFSQWGSANRLQLKHANGHHGFLSFNDLLAGELVVHDQDSGVINRYHSIDALLDDDWALD